MASSRINSLARFSTSLLLLLLVFSGDLLRHAAVSADVAFTSITGLNLGRSSRDPRYKIEFHSAESPFHPENGQESVVATNKDGQSYTCFLPIIEEPKPVRSVLQQNASSIIVEADRRIKLKTPDEILDVLKDECFYRDEGWWTYEFCHLKHLRQLHLKDDKAIQEFVLGVFDRDATAVFNADHSDISLLKDPRSKDASQRYHAHQYTNGSICDLSNQPRAAEIRFVCSETAIMISSIKEVSTCKYVVTIQCPLLCKHPVFQQERPKWHTIHCNEIPGDAKEPSVENNIEGTQITIVDDDTGRYAT